MHFLAVMAHPSNQLLLSTAKQMEEIMAGYATLYAYDNLSTDPYPGKSPCPCRCAAPFLRLSLEQHVACTSCHACSAMRGDGFAVHSCVG